MLIIMCTVMFKICYILYFISLIGTFIEMLKLGKYEFAQRCTIVMDYSFSTRLY